MDKKIKFTFTAITNDAQNILQALEHDLDLNIEKDSVQIEELVDSKTENIVRKGEETLQKSEDYLRDLENFYNESELICAEYQIQNPYVETVERAIKKKKLNKQEYDQIKSLKELAKKAPTFSLIKKYLIDLPEGADFDELRFRQNLLKINFDLPKTLLNPRRLDERVMNSFENYRRLYTNKYIEMIRGVELYLDGFWKKEKELRQKILTLKTLDKIEILGEANGDCFQERFDKIRREFVYKKVSNAALKKALEHSPVWRNIHFSNKLPQKICDDFLKDINQALESKFSLIRTKGVLDVLRNSKKDSIQKLVKLLQLTEMNKIVKLFNSKTAPVIGRELSKILNEQKSNIVHLGDFKSRIKKIVSSQDLKLVSQDFESFLFAQKKGKKNIIIQ